MNRRTCLALALGGFLGGCLDAEESTPDPAGHVEDWHETAQPGLADSLEVRYPDRSFDDRDQLGRAVREDVHAMIFDAFGWEFDRPHVDVIPDGGTIRVLRYAFRQGADDVDAPTVEFVELQHATPATVLTEASVESIDGSTHTFDVLVQDSYVTPD